MWLQVDSENFQRLVLEEPSPVLLAWMRMEADNVRQKKMLAKLSGHYGEGLKVRLVEQGMTESFRERFDIRGTPTYLLFDNGVEKQRLLGEADEPTLVDFIRNNLVESRPNA